MVRKGRARRLKLEAFWRGHLKAWRDSTLNQREYCELHGLPLKRFGNWRAEFKNEQTIVPEGLLYRRGGGDQPRLNPRRRETLESPLLILPFRCLPQQTISLRPSRAPRSGPLRTEDPQRSCWRSPTERQRVPRPPFDPCVTNDQGQKANLRFSPKWMRTKVSDDTFTCRSKNEIRRTQMNQT